MARKNKKAYNEYLRVYMIRRYHERKAWAIERLGGCCVSCGSTEKLEFDHIDASKKSLQLGRVLHTVSRTRFEAELDMCQLLCRGCHITKSLREGDLMRGDMGLRTCACGRVFKSGRALGGHRGGRGACTF